MNEASSSSKPCILVAPLDWGLGHSTRCVPIIHKLITYGCRVILAGAENSQVILRSEFPDLLFLPLQGYRIRYAASRAGVIFSIVAQIPKIIRAIRDENAWLQQQIKAHAIDAVISDNRYGLFNNQVYSVFITHQLQVKTGFGNRADIQLRKMHYKRLRHFNECWVPDVAGDPNLAGTLSHPSQLPQIKLHYTGPLTRFKPSAETPLPHYILILLSGPEPQRSLLEKKLLQQAKDLKKPILVIRGLPGETSLPPVPYHINIMNHLPAATLQKAIESAAFVVARTGYSTVMDLMLLQKKCILIPTPGQTEQEYLARHLMQTQQALCIAQQKFQLEQAMAMAKEFPYKMHHFENAAGLDEAIMELLEQLQKRKQKVAS